MSHLSEIELYAKHGGVHLIVNAPEEKINQYVGQLPEAKRESMFSVLKELEKVGYISLPNDGVFADGEGRLGGSDDC